MVVSLDWKQRDITERVKGTVDATAVANATTMCSTRMANAERVAETIGTEKEVQHAVPGVKGTEVHQGVTSIAVKDTGKGVPGEIETGMIDVTAVVMTVVTVIVMIDDAATGITTTATGGQGIETIKSNITMIHDTASHQLLQGIHAKRTYRITDEHG